MVRTSDATAWGWGGTVAEFAASPESEVLGELDTHHHALFAQPASGSQRGAWRTSIAFLRKAFRCSGETHSSGWGLVLEYELPLEGGRRPDAVVLVGGTVVVIEFKESALLTRANADQALAYARDLHDYHSTSRGREVVAVLASTSAAPRDYPGVVTTATPEQLAQLLVAKSEGAQVNLGDWLSGEYAPLPTIVQAARRIFQHEPLPRIRQAESLGVHDTVTLVQKLAEEAERDAQRILVFIAGVPGSGKTLAGLRIVYEHHETEHPATFLSGNGPLVKVLQDALGSTVFVKDLHKAVNEYGAKGKTPKHHVVVFDEAQRAWDREKMLKERQYDASEPDVLVRAGSRVADWVALVGLVGDGQEIHGGEESGIGQWADAVRSSDQTWTVHCPPRLASSFSGLNVAVHAELDLTRSMRSRRAERLHEWVTAVLGADPESGAEIAGEIEREIFPIRLARDLDIARTYARERYRGEPQKLYGLLASSHDKALPAFGMDNSWAAKRFLRVERWFNDPSDLETSACALEQTITEFECQGLELDLPIVGWGSDLLWDGDGWTITPVRRKYPLKDPAQIVLNTYRVLLTRGRDGLVMFVPPDRRFDKTADVLLTSGATLIS